MKKLILSIFVVGLFALTNRAYADVVCQPVYGGGQNCITTGNVAVNKKVCKPEIKDECKVERGDFVDNLGTNDPKFSANQTVTFQVSLTNKGSTTLLQTQVRDIFPGYVNFQSGNGNFDQNTKTLIFTVDNLAPNETRTFTLQGKVVDTANLPEGITCVVNQATATTNSGQMGQDNSQFCIQKAQVTTKGGLPILPPGKVITTPPTGPEMFALVGLLPAGLSGWLLRRKSFNSQGGKR